MTKSKTDTKIKEKKELIRKPNGTIEVSISIPWKDIKTQRDKVIENLSKDIKIPGFRKGKAPKKLIEEKLDEAMIREEVLKLLLPKAYFEIINKNNVRPIMDPKFHLEGELKEDEDWKFHALTCETPKIKLGNYKPKVKKITAKSKIIVPGREKQEPKVDEILDVIVESTDIAIPSVLTEKEVDRQLAQTLDEVKKLGMSLDQYLTSTGKNVKTLREEYAKKANKDLKLELILQQIATDEKITVDETDIQKTIEGAKEEERESMQSNRYLLASILRQQKTLEFLKSL